MYHSPTKTKTNSSSDDGILIDNLKTLFFESDAERDLDRTIILHAFIELCDKT